MDARTSIQPDQPSRIDETESARTGRTTKSINLDQNVRAMGARMSGGLSPAALGVAGTDWMLHAAASPALRLDLAAEAMVRAQSLVQYSVSALAAPDAALPPAQVRAHDKRFAGEAWARWPYNVMAQGFLMAEDWWDRAIADVPGLEGDHKAKARFHTRQLLDAACPANNPALNPEVIEATFNENGDNLRRGFVNWVNDIANKHTVSADSEAEGFTLGEDLACTTGSVVYRNHLFELLQYAPTTDKVQAEPILITPAWIMKYYVLDLSPKNSMVRWLTDQGFTVFMISWRNPGAEDRDIGFDDYRQHGVMKAITAALDVSGAQKLHAVGYCLGGTLLSVAASAMARDGDERLASLTLLAAQLDFSEPGELQLFIGESELAMLESVMDEAGYLDARQMAGAFNLLRSNDLIWSRMVREYFLGLPRARVDMMAWNADATRMPAAMHSEYLRGFYLENAFADGRWMVEGRPVSFTDVRIPVLAVGTEKDHVAPWRSVYKLHRLADTEVTFVLTNGGHNGGIVSEPGHPRRRHRVATHQDLDRFESPDEWVERAPAQDGSWWESWRNWLLARGTHTMIDAVKPKRARHPLNNQLAAKGTLPEAPGDYVRMR
ncbi:MAG: alpha/beta fold hydrolase [Pseudomonadota bacterium]